MHCSVIEHGYDVISMVEVSKSKSMNKYSESNEQSKHREACILQ